MALCLGIFLSQILATRAIRCARKPCRVNVNPPERQLRFDNCLNKNLALKLLDLHAPGFASFGHGAANIFQNWTLKVSSEKLSNVLLALVLLKLK